MAQPLHEAFDLYITPELYTFEPVSSGVGTSKRSLSISRLTGDITLNEPNDRTPAQSFRALTVYGIMGLLSLSTTEYLVIITERVPVRERINGHTLYHATEFRVLPVSTSATNAVRDHPVEKRLVDLVEKHLSSSVLWFSYDFDLTRNLQAQTLLPANGRPLWETADDRFFWNKFLQSRFIDHTTSNPTQDLGQFILPVIYGSVEITQTHIGRIPFNFALISRRSRFRAGTRYFTRGIDSQGHVANYNETEQIVLIDPETGRDAKGQSYGFGGVANVEGRTKLSYVQTRGSVPVFWAEINNLRYKPDLLIMDRSDTDSAFKLHMTEQLEVYGPQVLVNLVKQKGHEKPVKEAFEKRFKEIKLKDVQYEYFDFAKECKAMKFENVKILIDRLKPQMDAMGYFHSELGRAAPVKTQIGSIRTNCMDCLDRTNVVQSAFAKTVLAQQLRAIGVLSEKEELDEHTDFMDAFRNIWADHADYVSKGYSGTGALKTDFTRTGVRTKKGLLADGQNSVMRYLKNNYFDGDRQDAFDLFTGAWIPRRGPAASLSLITDSRPPFTRSMPYVLAFSLLMTFASVSLPRTSTYSLLYFNIFWLSLALLSLIYILGHGLEYVAWPRLNPPTDVLFYDGPGYKSGSKGKGFAIPFNLDKRLVKGGIRTGGFYTNGFGAKRLTKPEEIEMGTRRHVD